jgi:hypothetical protein
VTVKPLAPKPKLDSVAGVRMPPTRSGLGVLETISDAYALALMPGDVVIVETPTGLAPLLVHGVRLGVAGEDGALEEVPVIDGALCSSGGRSLAWAVPNLSRCAEIAPIPGDESNG